MRNRCYMKVIILIQKFIIDVSVDHQNKYIYASVNTVELKNNNEKSHNTLIFFSNALFFLMISFVVTFDFIFEDKPDSQH